MSEKKLGLWALTALVFSSMLGAGVFSLPQNMAAVAGPAALLIGWLITGVGILFLAVAMLHLSRLKPELEGGIFTYARDGFGEVMGFLSAWGYWLCAVIANVSYLVVLFSALSFFTDSAEHHWLGEGNTWLAIAGASLLLWTIHFLLLRGVQTAAMINLLAILGKLIPLLIFLGLAIIGFRLSTFDYDFSGASLHLPLWSQVKQTMLITLWVFIGVEGAVVVSARARDKRDIGKATLLAVVAALIVYLLVSVLSLGIAPREQLATLRNPSMAGLLTDMIGPWGTVIIVLGIVLSVAGSYLSWTIMAAEIPYIAAGSGAFPKVIYQQNHHNAPVASLWLTNGSVQFCLLCIVIWQANYDQLLTIASEMVLVPYLLVGLYLTKVAYQKQLPGVMIVGGMASIYGVWLLYASGTYHLLASLILYAPGLLLFLYARTTHDHLPPLTYRDKFYIVAISLGALLVGGQILMT